MLTMTRPVIPHITTVSQKVALIKTSACSFGLPSLLPAVTGAEPRPASFVKRPLAMPYLAERRKELPRIPPEIEEKEKAEERITRIASNIYSI